VPDRVFEQADEVELIDLAPDDLLERLRAGKVYVSQQAARAIENFFRKGNLFALRELALRKTAERVNSQALDYRAENEVAAIWPTSERLLVCVSASPMSARLIRSARRMAGGLRAPWIALHVEPDDRPVTRPEDQRRLEANLRLAEELGATIASISGSPFAEAVIDYCRAKNVTKIVVGKPLGNRWVEWLRGSLVNDLIRRSGDVDVYVISGDVAVARSERVAPDASRASGGWRPYLWSIAAVAVCTAVCWGLSPVLHVTNLAMVYLASVVAVAFWYGRGPTILATGLSVAAFDVVFVPPFGTFAVSDTQYLVTFVVMLATGLIVAELSARVRAQSEAIRERERRTVALYSLSRELANLPTRDGVVLAAQRIIRDAMDVDVCIAPKTGATGLGRANEEPFPNLSIPVGYDAGVMRWVADHRRAAGRGTDTLPGGSATYLPLLLGENLLGVLGVRPLAGTTELTSAQVQLLQAFASQVAAALDRCELAAQAEHIRVQMETERVRSSLLSAVSHDLRTPLTSIAGAASLLTEPQDSLPAEERRELAESILDESDRLNRLVANLLDLTRLEAGALKLNRELQPIEEVVEVVLQRMDRLLRGRAVRVSIADDLPPVPIDGLLIQQVLVNLLDNAVKFTPAGSTLSLDAAAAGEELRLELADEGPGLPPGEETRIFEKFHRVEGYGRPGAGVGLAICRAIVELHGGRIVAENRPSGGAAFRVFLPFAARPSGTEAAAAIAASELS
ncbi:MAG TPA: sensor histidine kinase KdpD, partial [Pirellulales bacterium]